MGPHPLADVNGDGRPELVLNLFNDPGDHQWHALVLNASNGQTLADFPRRFVQGTADLKADGHAHLFLIETDGALVPAFGTIELAGWQGGRPTVEWSQTNAAWACADLPRMGPTWSTTAAQGMRHVLLADAHPRNSAHPPCPQAGHVHFCLDLPAVSGVRRHGPSGSITPEEVSLKRSVPDAKRRLDLRGGPPRVPHPAIPSGRKHPSAQDQNTEMDSRSQPNSDRGTTRTDWPARATAAPSMNEITLSLESFGALAELEGRPLAQAASLDALTADIRSRCGFLPEPLLAEVEDGRVLIRYTDAPEAHKAEAARLLERAGRRAQEGEHERVIAPCRRSLRLQPSLQAARRELARACIAAGRRDDARAALWQALRVNPRDGRSLVALAALLVAAGRADGAERLARMALETEPGDAGALEVLGSALLPAGPDAEALGAFDRALALNPRFPGARLGAARALLRQDRAEESRDQLEELFRQSRRIVHPTPVLTAARELYVETRKRLARRDLGAMRQAVEDFRRRLEEEHGVPIRVTDFEEEEPTWIQFSWTHGPDHHRIGGPPSLPDTERLHLLAQQLVRVQLEAQALDRLGCHGVTEADVHLNRDSGFPQPRQQRHPDALIQVVLSDFLGPHTLRLEHQPLQLRPGGPS
jgi:tetratricopeptide (TPR) repeat protein